MTPIEQRIVHKVEFKESLSLYEWLYIFSVHYYLPLKMTVMTLAITLLSLIILQGTISNFFLLFIISIFVAIILTTLYYLPELFLIVLIACPILIIIGLVILGIIFLIGYLGLL